MSHAAAMAASPLALAIAMIEPPLVALLVTASGAAELVCARLLLAGTRAVAVAAIAPATKEEELAAATANDES